MLWPVVGRRRWAKHIFGTESRNEEFDEAVVVLGGAAWIRKKRVARRLGGSAG
jgi:hypothetical protein